MAISGSDPIHDLSQVLVGIRRGEGAEGTSRAVPGRSKESPIDQVALSSESKERGGLFEQIQALPDIRVDHLASIREALEKGQHQIDGDRVAAGVIKEAVLNSIV